MEVGRSKDVWEGVDGIEEVGRRGRWKEGGREERRVKGKRAGKR